MLPVQVTGRIGTELGSPYWCSRLGVLRCIDRRGGDVITLDRSGGVQRRATGASVASVVRPRAEGGVVVATDRALAIASRDDLGDLRLWGSLLADARQRFVDGACSPTGRLYLGTVGYGREPGIAMVYSIDAGQAAGQPVVAGLTGVAGIAWSPDETSCYVNDDVMTWAFDYRPHRGIFDRRPLFRSMFGPSSGLRVDAEGGLWVCHTEAGLLARRTVDGELTAVVELDDVTACTFGGPDLATLYCTAGGAIWAFAPGVRGLETLPFRGELPPRHT